MTPHTHTLSFAVSTFGAHANAHAQARARGQAAGDAAAAASATAVVWRRRVGRGAEARAPGDIGWFESSRDLRLGLQVVALPADAWPAARC